VLGLQKRDANLSHLRRADFAEIQEPVAIILGCSDSRVPPEIVFDQGLGDLFVVRVAGNVVGPTQLDSVEFAALNFGTRLVVVLGHSQCGAVQATLEALQQLTEGHDYHLNSIDSRVRPAVEGLLRTKLRHDFDALLCHAVQANIDASVHHLRYGSRVLAKLAEDEDLLVVGAEYSVETGVVEFFDDVAVPVQGHDLQQEMRRN
jgi:carbonic anhydrase